VGSRRLAANWLFPDTAFRRRSTTDGGTHTARTLGGVIDLGDDRADPALLGEGFSPRVRCEAAVCREVLGRARVFAPLDVAETLDVTVRAMGSGSLGVAVNGQPLAELPLGPALADLRFRVEAPLLRRELNELTLGVSPGGAAALDLLRFERPNRRR
jgi:hypothetical protein